MTQTTVTILFVSCLVCMILAAGFGGFLFGARYGMRRCEKTQHLGAYNSVTHNSVTVNKAPRDSARGKTWPTRW